VTRKRRRLEAICRKHGIPVPATYSEFVQAFDETIAELERGLSNPANTDEWKEQPKRCGDSLVLLLPSSLRRRQK
jgi:hypothetical protein